MDKIVKGRIISAVRKLTFRHEPINDAEKRQKRGPMLYECEKCNDYVYKGSSEKNFLKLKEEFSEKVVRRVKKIVRDHIVPCVRLEGYENGFDWTEFLERMFVESEHDIQILCPDCDKIITDEQKRIRAEHRKANKEKK